MPNDPRIKFKKRLYDPSRNLMYEERTGGGGGSYPSGGGGGGGGGNIPWTPIGPSNPVKPVDPINPYPYLPSFPIVPTAPFDPYQRGPKSRADEAKMRMRRDAQKYYDRAQRPKIATPKMFDDIPRSDLPGIDILVDAPSAPTPAPPAGPSSRLLPGAKPTALSGITGKPPPRIDIKPANLLDPGAPAKIPRVLPSNYIDPQAQGTPREQMEHYVEQERLREAAKNKLTDAARTTIDTQTPLEQRIAGKMYEMRMGGATDAEMVQTANAMRAEASKLPPSGITAQTPPEGILAKEIMIRQDLLANPTTTREQVIQLKQEIAELEQRIKEIGDRSAAQTLKDTASKLEVGKSGGSGKSIGQRIYDMVKGKPKGIADLKKELRSAVADSPLEEQLKLHEREAVNPSNTPEQIEAVKQNIADIKKEIIAEQMAKVDATAKAASSKPGIGENFEAQKIDLEGKISKINDKISKSKSVTEKAQLGKQKQQYQQRIKAIERNLAIRDKAMGDIQKVQKTIDTAKQFIESGGTSKPAPAPAPARTPYKEKAPPMSTDAERLKLAKKALQEINEDIKNKGGFKDMFGNDVVRTPQEIENLKKTKANIEKTITDLETKVGSTLEANIDMINEDLKNPTLTREEIVEYNKLKADYENQLKMLEKASAPAPAPAPAPKPVRDVAPGERPPLNETFRTPDTAPPKAVTTPDYLQIDKPKLDFAKMFERTENLLKQAKEHRARVSSPEELAKLDRLELTLERALRELGNENPDAYNKAFAPVDLAEEIAETKSLLTTIEEEIANAKTPKEVAKLKKVKDTVERTLRDLKRGKTELYDTGTGKGLSEISIREFGEEMPTTSRIAERLQRVRIADENIASYLDLPKPPEGGPEPSPPASPPETELMETTPTSRRGLMERLSTANYERVDILDTIDELEGTPSRGGRVPIDEPIEIGDLGGTPSRGGRVSTTDISPPSSGSTTPSSESSGTRTPIEIDTAGPSAGPSRPAPAPAPAPGPKGKIGKGRAKIEPIKAPASAPPPKLNFGRTDLNIQGNQNPHVRTEFMNTTAGRASSSLRGLVSRAPTLKPPSINTIKRIGVEGGKMGAGIAVGIGVSYLMAQYFKAHPATDRFSQIGQQYAIGFSGAAAGNIVMRALAIAGRMGAKKVFTTTGMKIMMVESAYATRDAAAFVAVQLGVEIGTEALMDRYKFNHTTSKTTAAVAGSAVAITMGAKEGGYMGAILMAVFSAVSVTEAWFEGQEEDRMEEANKKATAEQANKVNSARMQLVKNLKLVDNDYDRAFHMLSPTQKKNINSVGAESATRFKNSLSVEFNPLEKERNGNPYLTQDTEPDWREVAFFQGVDMLALSGNPAFALLSLQEHSFQENEAREQEAKDKYFQAYVQWHIDKKKFGNWNLPPPPEDEGFRLLERDTLGSWRTSAEFSAELAYEQTENYNRVINNARNQVLNEWSNNMTTIDELRARDQASRDIVETAGLDEDFYKDYETYIIQDATSQLAVQFNHFGINYRDADQKLVSIAGRDPTVLPALDHYYEVMTQLSAETGLPVAELARLDALPKDEQERELGKVNAIRERVIRAGLLSDKALVDEFNGNLIRDMQSYGDNFEAIMRNINENQMLMGYSYLYGTNRTDFYRQLHLEAPVIVIPPNPYAGSTEFDYEKNRRPGDTVIYGYRYNLTDEQNQELEDYLYGTGARTTEEAMARAAYIYERDRPIYRKSDAEVAKDNNMTLDEYYAEYGYDMDKTPPVEPIEWKAIGERDPPPTRSIFAGQDESADPDAEGERQANNDLQASRIAGGGSADEFDRIAAGAYAASQRALVDAQGGNNLAGDQPQPRTNQYGETLREENDPDGP
jgi:hypothetical protein